MLVILHDDKQYISITVEVIKMADFITPQGLIALKNYKYHSGKYTWLDGAMNPFWEAAVKVMPMWVAPNLITFIGWLLIIFSYANILRFDYTLQRDVPGYCFILAAFCVWAYSTLDAIDGKQARRTKSSSPLGQLFDHGCDSFSTAFFILAIGQALKLQGDQMLAIFVACQIAFWTSTWMEHQTGILITNVGQFGVTEAHFMAIALHLLTGIFGQNLWHIHLNDIIPEFISAKISNQSILWAINLKIGGFLAFGFSFVIIVLAAYQILKTVYVSSARFKAFKECATMLLIVAFQLIWVKFSFYDKYRGLVLLNFGLLSSLLNCKVIISSVAKMELKTFHKESLPLMLGTVLMICCEFLGASKFMPTVFWAIFVVNTACILYFLVGVINQITTFLGIYCFTIKPQQGQKSQ